MSVRLPTYYLSHGGGPWPWMKAEFGTTFDKLETSLLAIRRELGDAPRAVLVVSAHWEANRFLVGSAAWPPMVYDYKGFPEHTYRIHYDAPGSPVLAERVRALLSSGGVPAALDDRRGFDHGTFSLMQPLYPAADMPIVQLSIRADYDPAAHLDVGRLLAPLRDEGVLIVGSGSSFHDLRRLGPSGTAPSVAFDRWLDETLMALSTEDRTARLANWAAAPAARGAHPEEDHLMPLLVAVGAADGEAGTRVYHQIDFMGAVTLSSFRFGSAPASAQQIRTQTMETI